MYYNIEIVGMRKKRDLKIVITIIILAIISIIACVGVIIYNKTKSVKEVANTSIIQENVFTNEDEKVDESKIEEKQQFINNINNIYNGKEGKRVFLTFDDGPSKEVTPYILDILDKYNIKATFFALGSKVKENPDILKRAYDDGHYIANHGYSHKYKSIYKSADTVIAEYNKTEEEIQKALGNENYSSNLFRFPGGSHGGQYEKVKKDARKKLNEYGIAYLDWNSLSYDAEGANTKEKILSNIKSTINGWNNVVILMHDASDKKITYESLEDVIKYLQKSGYSFKNIYDLL